MLKSLRDRLILSHILPLLIIIPLLGIALLYTLETQFLLPALTRELIGDAMLISQFARSQVDIWGDPLYAQSLLERVYPNLTTRVMLLDPNGRLLASSDPADINRLDQLLQVEDLADVQQGQVVAYSTYNRRLSGEAIDVLAPVIGPDGKVIGIVRLTRRYITFSEEFYNVRYLIGGILIFGLLLGVILGSVLALNISAPIQKVTRAVYGVARGDLKGKVVEEGPEELRLLARAVNSLVERLDVLEQARRRLLSNLVHELGRPLGAMRAALQALMGGAKKDPQLMDELLSGLDEEMIILQRLLDDLANLHDQVLGTLELDREAVALNEWLPRMLRSWQEAARKKRINWKVEIPPDLPTILVDPVRLGQVIGNLISNAIKYTPPRGRVSIAAGVEGDMTWIRVSDTGPGIPTDEQERIFTPFYRVHPGRRFPQGMGLGLTIARDLIVAHGGRLQIESTPGLGSHFTVWVPKNEQPPISLDLGNKVSN